MNDTEHGHCRRCSTSHQERLRCRDKLIEELKLKVKTLNNALTNQRLKDAGEWFEKNKRIEELEEALRSVCSRCSRLEVVLQVLKGKKNDNEKPKTSR